MALRSLASRVGLRVMMEGNFRSSSYSLRYLSDGKGRVLSEEERAKETVYIQVSYLSLSLCWICIIMIMYMFNWIEENGERKVGEAQEEGGSGKT